MALDTSVGTTTTDQATPVGVSVVDVPVFTPGFPSAEMVSSAAALFEKQPAWDGREGARPRLVIGPGVFTVSEVDPAKAERQEARNRESAWKGALLASTDLALERRQVEADAELDAVNGLAAAGLVDYSEVESSAEWSDHLAGRIRRRDREEETPAASITTWSRKSRARMVRTLAELDYSPLFEGQGLPAMLTLTYPDRWLEVVPDAATSAKHLRALSKRFQRAYGRPLVATWKREFQRRGAPHFHLLMVPPVEVVNGLAFRDWVSKSWADVVGASKSCGCDDVTDAYDCTGLCSRSEYARHRRAGTGVDYAEGMRSSDPRRLAIYFAKHGAYGAKEYQNHAPAAWVAAGSVGRFWGYWGLDKATATVEVTPAQALAAARTMRRWQNANGYRVQRPVFRNSVDQVTGEVRTRVRKSGTWSGSRMRGRLGFVIVNDGPSFASAMARYLAQVDGVVREP